MQTVRLNHAGAMIELPTETVVKNWLASISSAPAANTPPRIGEYWHGQGGVLIGICPGQDGNSDYYLIAPPDDHALWTDAQWHNKNTDIAAAKSDWDGKANTLAMSDGGSALAKQISALEVDGHHDFYLPARHELRMIKLAAPHLITKEWHWSSTQCSARTAFCQAFVVGNQDYDGKGGKLRARAVRRIQLSNLVIR